MGPAYDEPAFVVRSIWRLYGGWWDGDSAHLKPAPAGALAEPIEVTVADRSSGRHAPRRASDRSCRFAGVEELTLRVGFGATKINEPGRRSPTRAPAA
jgi:hypothetical protein